MGRTFTLPVAVVGAGPYGLSVAAHLRSAGVPTAVYGEPFSFWRAMPARMVLKSPWSASSLSDPEGRFSLDAYTALHGLQRIEPVPIDLFLSYGAWFLEQAVGQVDPTSVTCISRANDEFRIQLEDGRAVSAAAVVMATGIREFQFWPEFAHGMPSDLVLHTGGIREFDTFAAMEVGVIGAGQSALEAAVFLYEAGASVEVITRHPIRWSNRRLYEMGGLARKVFYPPADVGPVGLNWLVATPGLFRLIPTRQRTALGRRAVRPAGAKWLRPRFAPEIRTSANVGVTSMRAGSDRVDVETSDGVTHTFDRVLLGTGYRADVRRIQILDDELRGLIGTNGGFPLLDRHFQTSVRGLHFVGAIASHSFGPLCKFVAGADVAARAVASAAS